MKKTEKNNLWMGMLAITLVFGMAVIGCDDGSTGDGSDTWSNVTSFNQLNGTWKGSYSQSMTMREMVEQEGEEWDSTMQAMFGDMRVTVKADITATINASAKTQASSMTMTQTYSGTNIAAVWPMLSGMLSGESGVTVNNSNHSITMTYNEAVEAIPDEAITQMLNSGLQINQNGTKIRQPAGSMGSGTPEVIMTKQ
jgi:hypothetical protein